MTEFLLGCPEPSWAWNGKARGGLFLSATRLRRRRSSFPAAALPAGARVCIDSGGYTELHRHGQWTTPAADYVALTRRVIAEIGSVGWAAIQDWMCEPWMLEGGRGAPGTGLSVAEHQRRSTASLLELRALAPEVHWLPVVQGQTLAHYVEHVEAYALAGVDLRREPLVGVGSVCRRNRTEDVGAILRVLHREGLRLHGFGVKAEGLQRFACWLTSADSMAWSTRGRRIDGEAWRRGEPRRGLANSQAWAEEWRLKMQWSIERPVPHQLAIGVA